MNIQQAFEILSLDITASKTDIKDKHRQLIKKFHSDTETGSHDKSSSINNARDIALKYVDDRINVSMVKQIFDIVSVENTIKERIAEYKIQSEAIYTKISRKFGSRYKSYKTVAKTAGLISTSIALLSSKLLPIFPDDAKNLSPTVPFTVFAVMSGIFFLILNSAAERIQDSIDDLKDTLSDKGNYYDILNDILQFQTEKTSSFSRQKIEDLCVLWFDNGLNKYSEKNTIDRAIHEMFFLGDNSFKRTVQRIGVNDFVKFFISKGLDKNILTEKEYHNSGITEIIYEINQKANLS